ncbi:MAG: hypothetical protein KDC35_13905 [Acidobacteria bacterium]|nr:hypothetical protein [Acidobacteriota bacterium]
MVLLILLTIQSENPLEKMSFLIGHWHTESRYEDGTLATGDLKYEWVLGGSWIKFTFVGQHPKRPMWEAHGMIRATDEGTFESYAFFSSDDPLVMHGHLLDDGRIRFTYLEDQAGIDYIPSATGAKQENWRLEDGEHMVVMTTTYQSAQP